MFQLQSKFDQSDAYVKIYHLFFEATRHILSIIFCNCAESGRMQLIVYCVCKFLMTISHTRRHGVFQ
jgi:hypothetical protein